MLLSSIVYLGYCWIKFYPFYHLCSVWFPLKGVRVWSIWLCRLVWFSGRRFVFFVVFSINVFLRRTDERHWQYSDPIFICDLKRVLEAKQAKTCTIYICTKRAHQLDLNTTSQSFQINSANLYRGKSTQIHYTYNTPTYTLLRTLSWKAAAQRCPLVEDFYLIRRSFKCRPL